MSVTDGRVENMMKLIRSCSFQVVMLSLWCLAGIAQAGSTLVVSTTADSGPGSLRQAIIDANAAAGAHLVTFAIPEGDCSASGVCEIVVDTDLPIIAEAVTIDGTTQPRYGSAPENVCATVSGPSYMRVQVTGNGTAHLLELKSIEASDVHGLSLAGTGATPFGIKTGSAAAHWIHCNHIGVNAEGTTIAKLNDGVCLGCNANAGNGIVGTNSDGIDDLAERNVIAGGGRGINQNAYSNFRISGNFFGLTADGVTPLYTSTCLFARQGASNNLYGSNFDGLSDDLEGNIFGACGIGFYISTNANTSGNVFAGNRMGSNILGESAGMLRAIVLGGLSSPTVVTRNRIEKTTTIAIEVQVNASFAAGSVNNCIWGNIGSGLVHSGAMNIDFSSNYWGNASGPSGDYGGSGDSATATSTGNLTISPWLTAPPDSCGSLVIFTDGFESGNIMGSE